MDAHGTARGLLAAGIATIGVVGIGSGRASPARAEDAPVGIPFPTTGRQTVRAGKPYVIDGKQVIPGNSAIRVEGNVTIVGTNSASLEVQGGLLVHGTQDRWVRIQNVDFSPTQAPADALHFDMASLSGCTFAHGEEGVYDGEFTIENSCLQGDCKFSVRMRSGFLRIMTTEFKMPCTIDARPVKGRRPEVAIRTEWMKDLTLTGDAMATVRDAEVKGTLAARDFTDLVVDGCDLFGDARFAQPAQGTFARLQLLKCNLFLGSKLCLARPASADVKAEKVRVEKFHFGTDAGADTSDKAIGVRIEDGADDPAVSVRAFWQNPQPRRHFFLSETLRTRAPP